MVQRSTRRVRMPEGSDRRILRKDRGRCYAADGLVPEGRSVMCGNGRGVIAQLRSCGVRFAPIESVPPCRWSRRVSTAHRCGDSMFATFCVVGEAIVSAQSHSAPFVARRPIYQIGGMFFGPIEHTTSIRMTALTRSHPQKSDHERSCPSRPALRSPRDIASSSTPKSMRPDDYRSRRRACRRHRCPRP